MRLCMCLATALLTISPVLADVTLRWVAEAQRPAAQTWDAYRGETLLLEPVLREAGTSVAWTGSETATLYWQTNGMASAWWSAPALVVTGTPGLVRATWSPTNDVGATRYLFFVGVQGPAGGKSYRANGTLKMLAAPGSLPNELELPARVFDFALVVVTNAPWATPAELAAASTNAQDYADAAASQALINAQDFADAAAAQALTNAQDFADAAAAQALTNAQDFADAAAAQALTNAQDYADAMTLAEIAERSITNNSYGPISWNVVEPQPLGSLPVEIPYGNTYGGWGWVCLDIYAVSGLDYGQEIKAVALGSSLDQIWRNTIIPLPEGTVLTNDHWYVWNAQDYNGPVYNVLYDLGPNGYWPAWPTNITYLGNMTTTNWNGVASTADLAAEAALRAAAAAAATNYTDAAIAAVSWPSLDTATNLLWTVTVSNGHWLITGETP